MNLASSQVALFTLLPGFFSWETRVTGVAVLFNIGTILGDGFAPFIAASLISTTGVSIAPAFYTLTVSVLGLTAVTYLLRGNSGHYIEKL